MTTTINIIPRHYVENKFQKIIFQWIISLLIDIYLKNITSQIAAL